MQRFQALPEVPGGTYSSVTSRKVYTRRQSLGTVGVCAMNNATVAIGSVCEKCRRGNENSRPPLFGGRRNHSNWSSATSANTPHFSVFKLQFNPKISVGAFYATVQTVTEQIGCISCFIHWWEYWNWLLFPHISRSQYTYVGLSMQFYRADHTNILVNSHKYATYINTFFVEGCNLVN